MKVEIKENYDTKTLLKKFESFKVTYKSIIGSNLLYISNAIYNEMGIYQEDTELSDLLWKNSYIDILETQGNVIFSISFDDFADFNDKSTMEYIGWYDTLKDKLKEYSSVILNIRFESELDKDGMIKALNDE